MKNTLIFIIIISALSGCWFEDYQLNNLKLLEKLPCGVDSIRSVTHNDSLTIDSGFYEVEKVGVYDASPFYYDVKNWTTDTAYFHCQADAIQRIHRIVNGQGNVINSRQRRGWGWSKNDKWYEDDHGGILIKMESVQGMYWIRIQEEKITHSFSIYKIWGEWVTGERKSFPGDVS